MPRRDVPSLQRVQQTSALLVVVVDGVPRRDVPSLQRVQQTSALLVVVVDAVQNMDVKRVPRLQQTRANNTVAAFVVLLALCTRFPNVGSNVTRVVKVQHE